jgi:hypothetical protein
VKLIFNQIEISEVIIDPHYEKKHGDTVSDLLILKLINKLNMEILEPEKTTENYEYIKVDPICFDRKSYRLILLIEKNKSYLGVINTFRRPDAKE